MIWFILTKDTWENHLQQLKIVYIRLRDAGLKIHANKSFFARTELENILVTGLPEMEFSPYLKSTSNTEHKISYHKKTIKKFYWYGQLL